MLQLRTWALASAGVDGVFARMRGATMTLAAAAAMMFGMTAAVQADPVEDTEMFEETFVFPLSPGAETLVFPQFDAMGGTRELQEVTLAAEGQIGASVTVENDSLVLPAPDLALAIAGFMTIDVESLALVFTFNATDPTDGSVMQSDGVPDSGPDFWDFGFFSDSGAGSETITTNLAAFVGNGTINAEVFAGGGFSIAGATDATITVTDFMGEGFVRITYAYKGVPGACCFDDGSCQVLTSDECIADGGVFNGPGTDCSPNPCDPPAACCFPDGSCENLLVRMCVLSGGSFQGRGSRCGANVCPQPGACCLPNGDCVDVAADASPFGRPDGARTFQGPSTACTALGGIFQGAGTTCVRVVCPVPVGACCFDDGSCVDAQEQRDCILAGGMFQGVGSVCSTVKCPQPTGACCLMNGECIVVEATDCSSAGGLYEGNGTTCVDVKCPQPPGACCLPTTCLDVTEDQCLVLGGEFQGVNTQCADADCDFAGACCLLDGCVDVFLEVCNALGGQFQGVGTDCADPGICGDGACCLPSGICVGAAESDCVAIGGIFQGAGIPCAGFVCPLCTDTTDVDWDLDACSAPFDDFSEFIGEVSGTCAVLQPSIFYRDQGGHSCAEDRFGNPGDAMCGAFNVSDDSTFMKDHPQAMRANVLVTAVTAPTYLTELRLWQRGPAEVNGSVNNTPQKWGVRLLRDGVEIFRDVDIDVEDNWTEHVFTFAGLPYTLETPGTQATFEFELYAYDYADNGGPFAVWDVDDISMNVLCCSP